MPFVKTRGETFSQIKKRQKVSPLFYFLKSFSLRFVLILPLYEIAFARANFQIPRIVQTDF